MLNSIEACLSLFLSLSGGTIDGEAQHLKSFAGPAKENSHLLDAYRHRKDSDDQMLRRAMIDVDTDILARFGTPGGHPLIAEFNPDAVLIDHELEFRAFSDVELVLTLDAVREELGIRTWTGRVKGEPSSFVLLSHSNGNVFGIVETESQRFLIEPVELAALGNTGHVISEYDLLAMHDPQACDHPPPQIDAEAGPKPAYEGSKTLSSGTLSVLVLYTSAVAGDFDVAYLSAGFVSAFNSQLSNAGISGSARLLHFAEVSYNESGMAVPDILNDLRAVSVTGQSSLESTWKPDVVVFLVDDDLTSGARGAAPLFVCRGLCEEPHIYSQGDPSEDTPHAIRIVVQDDWALADYTFSHELGHGMGGAHDDTENQSLGVEEIANGYIYTGTKQTLMGGYGGSVGTVVRKPFWSDPLDDDNGTTIGITNDADMVGFLPGEFPIQDDRGNNGAVAPSAPASASIHNEQCFGLNTVSWSTSSGTDAYHVFKSSSAAFPVQALIYSGNSTTAAFSVSSGETAYVRIEACNDGGCSSYTTATGTGTYHSGCL